MHKKIRLLIIISVLGLLALSGIQGYLINNTYKLEKAAFISETRKSISRIDDLSPNLDIINEIWQDGFLNVLADYRAKIIKKQQVLPKFDSIIATVNDLYITAYQKDLRDKNINQTLKFQKIVRTAIVFDSIQRDTLFIDTNKTPLHLLGDYFTLEEGHKVSNSLWLTDHSSDRIVNGSNKQIAFNLQFETEDRMNIEGWEKIVLGRMAFLLFISILIFLLVFGLLFYAIKSFMTQKKIADVKTDFVNNITHELKTPLSTLTLAIKMLKVDADNSSSANTRNFVNTIERQNKRLQKLIDQVLNNSLGYQEIQLKKEIVNAGDYLNMIIDDFQLSLGLKSIQIDKKITVNTEIYIDKFYFTTALLNILENAVKYGKDDLQILITANSNQNFEISISDNGIGISKKELKFLFDKFYRVGNTEVHNVKGLGLGLYYTNQIVKAHQGKLLVESEVNVGTKFTISIPVK
ncbi:sensor histidine kinase [Polaribacter aestuariivivens]|uniref:sensor histidine kinase n=1 Tax=Polaribacter aestuariivivens TaxID=2304626 RepID=UPI003F4953B7